MTTAILIQPLCFREFTANGVPAAFGTVETYQAGTTTPIATYTDSTGGTANPNPVVLNARGEAQIWCLPNVSYKFVVADASGNPIRTVDNVQQSQLITLYGGVDTGIANAYVLTFSAPFASYTDGIVVIWIPSNTNTSSSTININGLGAINIVNGDGSAFIAGEITANIPAQILIKGGQAILQNPYALNSSGSFTVTWVGFSAAPTAVTAYYVRSGNIVTISFGSFGSGLNTYGTSNSTAFQATGVPSQLWPTNVNYPVYVPCLGLMDNGTTSVNVGTAVVGNTGTITFNKDNTLATWTASGNKGFSYATSIVYPIK